MSETFQKLDKSFFQAPKELRNLINKENLQAKVKEIQAGYLHSSYCKDVYLYLSQNKLPSSKMAIKREEALAEKYILLDSLLFKVNPEKVTVVLAVPEACIDKIIMLYHSKTSGSY